MPGVSARAGLINSNARQLLSIAVVGVEHAASRTASASGKLSLAQRVALRRSDRAICAGIEQLFA